MEAAVREFPIPRKPPSPSQWLRRYTGTISTLGIAIVLLALTDLPADWPGLVLFAGLAAIAELSNVELFTSSRSRVSVSSIIAIASILLFGPLAGALTHMVSGMMTLVTTTLRSQQPEQGRASRLQRSAFNTGMFVTSAAIAGWVYVHTGGTAGNVARLSNAFPLLAAATADVLANLTILIGVIALQTRRHPVHIWKQDFQWSAPIAIIGGALGGGVLALAYEMYHLLGLAVFLLPILSTAYSFRLYVANMKVYVDELEQTLAHLRESQERYALAARGANDGLWDWDLKTNEVHFSPRWRSMLGEEGGEKRSSPDEWFNRVHPDDLDQVKIDLSAHLAGQTDHFQNEHRMRHRDGTYRWMLTRGLAVRDADGTAYRMAGSQTDITERKLAEEQLLHDAFHDALTGLPNRALFMDRLSQAIERTKRHTDYMFAVLFLDLDGFKIVNDSLGHTVGDQLLVAIAPRLETCLRNTDTVARLGGDEFTILLEGIRDTSEAVRTAERIQDVFLLPFNFGEHEVYAAASIGIVLGQPRYSRPEDVLRDADIAMHRAKAQGKAQYTVFDAGMRARAIARLELETDMRRALSRHEFRIHYQPIVSLERGRIAGFEALLRWQHPTRGLLPPAEFISVAEENRLILAIGQWVLREACYQMRIWQAQFPSTPPLTINVNLSSRQLEQPDLIAQVGQALHETGLDAHDLKLEITESAIMANPQAAAVVLSQLKALGLQLQMDDFGTGYSSLGYLHQFPFDSIKIDRSFVSRMGVDGTNAEIVQTIIILARELDMGVVAEGVETPEQLARLKALECDFVQGYFISKPLDSRTAEAWIARELPAERMVGLEPAMIPRPAGKDPGTRELSDLSAQPERQAQVA